MIKVMGEGRLGRDPELKNTNNGKVVANLSVASDFGFGDQKKTVWLQVVVWGKRAENCVKFLMKGSHILFSGNLETHDYENKDGVKVTQIRVQSEELVYLAKLRPQTENNSGAGEESNEDIPF